MQEKNNEKKHIAFYIGSLHKGGAERVFVNLAEFFLLQGYKVTMVTQYQKPADEEYQISSEIRRVISDLDEKEITKSRISNFCRRVSKLHRIWKTEQPDLVLSCVGKNNFMTIVTTMFTKTRPVVSVVGEAKEEYPSKLMKRLANLLFPMASGIILQTERSKYFFSKKIQKKAVILPNSLNQDFIKERYCGERDKTIVAVGRMDANKNHEMMIRAFARVAEKYPEYRLIIYGDGELRKHLEDVVKELRLDDKVQMPGVVTDIAGKIEKASLFLITSYSEGVSNALIEALASGLAVIATDVPSGGTVELMEHEKNGLIIPAGDTDALVVAMDRILGDSDLMETYGENAAKIQEKLAPERVNQLWKAYFDSIINRSKGSGILKMVAFAMVFLLLLCPVSYMVRTNGDVKDRFAGFYAEKKDSLDVVMIGSSPVFPYYSAPMLWGETGIAMYPLSSNMQRPVAMKYLVEEAEKTQTPELYIFEMRMFSMSDIGLSENMAYTRGVTDNLKYSYNRVKTINAMVPSDQEEGRLSYYIDIMKYHTNWKMLFLPSEWKNMFYHNANPLKGFYVKDEVGPQPMPECGGASGVLPLPDRQEQYLYDLLDYLKTNQKEALFIVSPYGETLEEQQMFNTMEGIVSGYGYPFLNMNNYYDEIGIVFEEDFADYGSHTNAVGARKCTAFLEQYLQEHYRIEDKRGNSSYSSYDQAYDLWQNEYERAAELIRERIANHEYAEKTEE